MSDLRTTCKQCSNKFDPKTNPASARAITIAGAGVGAAGGAKIGIALGPYGAFAGTVPGAVVGGVGGHLVDSTWVTCPDCGKTKLV